MEQAAPMRCDEKLEMIVVAAERSAHARDLTTVSQCSTPPASLLFSAKWTACDTALRLRRIMKDFQIGAQEATVVLSLPDVIAIAWKNDAHRRLC